MSYQVLARKYRPQNFDEVVGQSHVTETLKNAILKNRIHQAYLFTGVRGTGKTSMARIFAKSLNCEQGPTPNPCNVCSHCVSITKGNFLDVIEIDGASNTSVDSVRELREQVKYMPAAGRYKVYIIDEVHMLSTSAFNALLKTLEEPPPHVIFLFATTEAHKIPVTILSRCQRFDLRRLSLVQIKERLKSMCETEKIQSDEASLDALSRHAEGSMRDAQSLLDMAIGVCVDRLDAAKIQDMLGLGEDAFIEDLTSDCLRGELKSALAKADEIYARGFDLGPIAQQWVDYLHDLTLLKSAGREALGERAYPDRMRKMEQIVQDVGLDALQIAFQTVYRAAEEMFRSESPKILFDLLLVKLVHGSPYQNVGQVLAGAAAPAARPTPARPSSRESAPLPPEPSPSAPRPAAATPPAAGAVYGEDLLARALKKRAQIRAYLDEAVSRFWEGSTFVAVFEPGSLSGERMKEWRDPLAEALAQESGLEAKVEVRFQAGRKSGGERTVDSGPPLPSDPVIQQAVEILNARVQEVKKN